ncbi:TetR/AcrR family transcriptional regulator [Sciscionella sediminilitoris]|uniref:TetR/AcrR family transcriptional regulator n=1 Tax=Sciscionella sediminilitoris TaxID=1445613 RepID=UPI0018D0EF75|nr:TetR/AcrR family transcriptional regulator [Sciscionella sp. SE31]
MTGVQRRTQLLDVARSLFAEKGFEATSIEEIAARAGVSKPVVYEHFGGKEGVYAVVVDREMQVLMNRMVAAVSADEDPKLLLERAALALLNYVDSNADGFLILARDSPVASTSGTFSSLLNDIATQAEEVIGVYFDRQGHDRKLAALYAQALVGMVAFTGQWWLVTGKPRMEEVAAHLVNIAWHGLENLESRPRLEVLERARQGKERERE